VGSAKEILILTDFISEVSGWTLSFLVAFLMYVVGEAMQVRPNMASSSDIYQDFESAPRHLDIPDKRHILGY
jgi:hypothetical protein